ncbi:hypothetical protein PVAP13_3KG158827 [Panicum virgatum]|uniref:BZIP domain-containing protein n=1 Tax=Panicum virgatum TaxID=38727 RepID=A0A8T0UVG5_PANVG|nr:hypothetical protein PVAP13_3KG158827 [Panicum virgatum]
MTTLAQCRSSSPRRPPSARQIALARQYAQRSHVWKLQYIAELEGRVQALKSEGVEVSTKMEFLTQQNIMLDLENKALKQRMESLA